MKKLISILIPAKNEQDNIINTVLNVISKLDQYNIKFEILIVNDGSTDTTAGLVTQNFKKDKRVRLIPNEAPFGIGNAIAKGLEHYKGDYVIITMADASDDPQDMVRYIDQIKKGYDCCFGDRFKEKNLIEHYPKHKLMLNRIANWFIHVLLGLKYRDVTNAFKCYSREAIDGIKPILSHHFNITIELPLKAIVRGYSYAVIPTKWRGRKRGVSNLKIKEMGSRYLFILLYVLMEKLLCAKDYKKS